MNPEVIYGVDYRDGKLREVRQQDGWHFNFDGMGNVHIEDKPEGATIHYFQHKWWFTDSDQAKAFYERRQKLRVDNYKQQIKELQEKINEENSTIPDFIRSKVSV